MAALCLINSFLSTTLGRAFSFFNGQEKRKINYFIPKSRLLGVKCFAPSIAQKQKIWVFPEFLFYDITGEVGIFAKK